MNKRTNDKDRKDRKEYAVKEPAAAVSATYQKSPSAEKPSDNKVPSATIKQQEFATTADLVELKSDLHTEIVDVKVGLKDDITDVKVRVTKIEATMVTKDYLDFRLAELEKNFDFKLAELELKFAELELKFAALEGKMYKLILTSTTIIIVVLGLLIKL